ncbi:hypothetical protein S83_042032, partial [Arachis hypogaea]
ILDSQKFQSNDALNNVQDLDIMGLHARARAQEEEIFSLWEQVAVACMKLCLAVIAVLKGGTNRYGSAQRRHQQGLHARARAQEEEIFSLWEQVAVACMKMLNEKCNLERQFSELRNAKDGETRADLLSEASVEYETK